MKTFVRIFSLLMALLMVLAATMGCMTAFAASGEETSEPDTAAAKTDDAVDAAPAPEGDDGVVIADENDIYISVTEQGFADDGDYFWTLHIKNGTAAEAMFTMENMSLDGLCADPQWGLAVAAGDEIDTNVFWSKEALAGAGFDESWTCSTATFNLDAYNNEDWAAPSYVNGLKTIYFVDEADVNVFSYVPKETDMVVFDTDQATMVVTGIETGYETNGYEDGIATAQVILVNKTDDRIRFEMPNTMIDGSPYQSATMDVTVSPHASALTSFKWTFSVAYMQGSGILDAAAAFVPGVEFTLNLKVADVDDLTVPTIAEGAFTIIQ